MEVCPPCSYAAEFLESVAEHALLGKMHDATDGYGWSEEHMHKLAEPATRRRIAELIGQCRVHDADAVAHMERALARGR